MQYILIFLAVLAVILCMNVFIFLAVRQAADKVKEQVEGRFMDELSSFDELYEQKAARLQKLKEEQELLNSNIFQKKTDHEKKTEAKAEAPVRIAGNKGFDIPVSRTANPEFFKEYRYVRDRFRVNARDLVEAVLKLPADEEMKRGNLAAKALEILSQETAFSMSTLEGEEQLQLIGEALPEECHCLLKMYLEELETEEKQDQFCAIGFWEYLGTTKALYSGDVAVYTPDPDALAGEPVTLIQDETICEGVRVRRGSRMYDFSI